MFKNVLAILAVVIVCGCPAMDNGRINDLRDEGEAIREAENLTEGEGEIVLEGEIITEGEGEIVVEGEAVGDFHLEVLYYTEDGGLYEAFLKMEVNPLLGRWQTLSGEIIDNSRITRVGANIYAQRFGTRLETDEWPVNQFGTYFDWLMLGESPLFVDPYVITIDDEVAFNTNDTKWTYDGQPLVVWNGFVLLDIYGPVTWEEARDECDWCSSFEGEDEGEGE